MIKSNDIQSISSIDDFIKSLTPEDVCFMNRLLQFVSQLSNGQIDVPERCGKCPALTYEWLYGLMSERCALNVDWAIGDSFFSSLKGRPEWCPAVKYKERANEKQDR